MTLCKRKFTDFTTLEYSHYSDWADPKYKKTVHKTAKKKPVKDNHSVKENSLKR